MNFYPKSSNEVSTTNGTAECPAHFDSSAIQVSLKDITGTGTATITATPLNGGQFEDVVDGSISLSNPTTLIIQGRFVSVKAVSGTDDFTLVVSGV